MDAPEHWLPVVGYEGLYEVSDHGQVKSFQHARPRILRVGRNPETGYFHVVLCKDGHRSTRHVHSLVLEAFTGPRPEGAEARHLDGDRTNNRWAPGSTEEEVRANGGNLMYGTSRDNNLDQVLHGTHNKSSRTKCAKDHEYTEENTILVLDPDGLVRQRRCRTCSRERARKNREIAAQPPLSDEERCTAEEGCDRHKSAKGLCGMHYQRQRTAEIRASAEGGRAA